MGALKLNTTQQFRRDNAATWVEKNPVLLDGEPGLELDTGKIKIGDGAKGWNALPYFMSDKAQTDLSNVENSVFQQKAELAGIGKGGIISATYAELKNLVDEKKLIPGQMYCLTDYQTRDTVTVGPVEELVLTTIDNSHFSPKCNSLKYPQDIITYDFNDTTYGSNKRNGFITWRHSTNKTGNYANISAPGDWRVIETYVNYLNMEYYEFGGEKLPITPWKVGEPVELDKIYRSPYGRLFVAICPGIPVGEFDFNFFQYCGDHTKYTKGKIKIKRPYQEPDMYLLPSENGRYVSAFNPNCNNIEFRGTSNIHHGNVFDNCSNCIILDGCSDNLFTSYTPDNVAVKNNIFGSGCKNNVFGGNCESNVIMGNFEGNTVSANWNKNTVTGECMRNEFCSDFIQNNITTQFNANTVSGDSCTKNRFEQINNCTLGSDLENVTVKSLSNRDLSSYTISSCTIQAAGTNKYVYWGLAANGSISSHEIT